MRGCNQVGALAMAALFFAATPSGAWAQSAATQPAYHPGYAAAQPLPGDAGALPTVRPFRMLKQPVGQPPLRANGYPTVAQRPSYRVAERPQAVKPATGTAALRLAGPDEHPLAPALAWAKAKRPGVAAIKDYSAIMVKQERLSGELGEQQYMFVKVRHEPFSVYTYFMAPADLKGQEAIYVEGKNGNEIQAHGTGLQKTMFGTVSLSPTGLIAMRGQRYPITRIGVLNLVDRLIEVAEKDLEYGESEVKIFRNATLNGRSCTCLQVVHPVPRNNFLYHIARIFIDDELCVPVRHEAYDWPKEPGGAPELLEQYTYVNLKMNNGFTDADFDVRNPNYGYQ